MLPSTPSRPHPVAEASTPGAPVRASTPPRWQPWLIAALVCLLLVPVAIAWIDRPVSLLAHATTHGNRWINHIAELPAPLFVLAWPAVIVFGVPIVLWRQRVPTWLVTLWLAAVAVGIASVLKQGLKLMFGRTWPETWTHDNPSFIGNGVFEFRLFGGDGAAYASFPSGHLSVMLAFASVLALRHRALRWPCFVAIALTALGQIAANYHWTSDVLAGSALGVTVGCAVIAASRRRQSSSR